VTQSPPAVMPESTLERSAVLAQQVADAIWDKKGFEVVALRVAEIVQYTDFLVIASATSDRHAVAIADGVEEALAKTGEKPSSVEGRTYGRWVLLDYGHVVVHIFHRPVRDYYQLERLFADAPRLALTEPQWIGEVSPDQLIEQSFDDYGHELQASAPLDESRLDELDDDEDAYDDGESADSEPADDEPA
jgi:ribosome-associated protein